MRTNVWVYLVVIAASLGAGIAIAGVPTFEDREPTIEVPAETTTTTTSTLPESDDADSEPVTTVIVDDTEPPADTVASDTVPPDTVPPDSAEEPEAFVSTTTVPASATTSPVSGTTTTTVPLLARDVLDVVVVNASDVGGSANNGSNALEALGYVNIGSFDSPVAADITVVFADTDVLGEARRLLREIGIAPRLVFPIDGAPDVPGLADDVQLMVYLGRDVVIIPFFN